MFRGLGILDYASLSNNNNDNNNNNFNNNNNNNNNNDNNNIDYATIWNNNTGARPKTKLQGTYNEL